VTETLELLVASLRREVRRLKIVVLTLVAAAIGLLAMGEPSAQGSQSVRARSLIIEDEAGRERILIGAPVPDPREGKRISPSVGLVINDENGFERFGVNLQANGRMLVGLDAPPGTGDERNRERIILMADQKGSAYIRFLNRKTLIPGRIVLDDEDRFYLEFLETADGKTAARRIGFKGEEVRELK
jgi:hypothetical protein